MKTATRKPPSRALKLVIANGLNHCQENASAVGLKDVDAEDRREQCQTAVLDDGQDHGGARGFLRPARDQPGGDQDEDRGDDDLQPGRRVLDAERHRRGIDRDPGGADAGQDARQHQREAADPADVRQDRLGAPGEHRAGIRRGIGEVLVGQGDEVHRNHREDEDDRHLVAGLVDPVPQRPGQ
jgi:hypothetical protein